MFPAYEIRRVFHGVVYPKTSPVPWRVLAFCVTGVS